MAIQSASLRERIAFERHETVSDLWLALPELAEVWADVAAIGEERYQVRIRYREDLIGLQDAQPALRIKYRGRILEVLDIREIDWREQLELTAQANRVDIPDLTSSARVTTKWPQP